MAASDLFGLIRTAIWWLCGRSDPLYLTMCHKTPLETYAEEICSAAKAISGWCLLEGLPQPSFDPQAPSVTLPPTAPQNVLNARQQLINASTKVQQLATEPSEYLPSLATHVSCLNFLGYCSAL